MSKRSLTALVTALAGLALAAPSASAEFGIVDGSVDGSVYTDATQTDTFTQAAGHPYSAGLSLEFNTEIDGEGTRLPSQADVRNTIVEAPPGLIGAPTAVPSCPREDFFLSGGVCPASTQVGFVNVTLAAGGDSIGNLAPAPVYNLEPPVGVPAQFGFSPLTQSPALATPSLRSEGDYGITFAVQDIPQTIAILDTELHLWGSPSDPIHDDERGFFRTEGFGGELEYRCSQDGPLEQVVDDSGVTVFPNVVSGPPCPAGVAPRAFLTNPADCSHGPFDTEVRVESWAGHTDSETFTSHDGSGTPTGATGCEVVPFDPEISVAPTTDAAKTPTGLNVDLSMPTGGLLNPDGIAQSPLKKAVVTLPEGMSVNPSAGEGLGVCSPADFAREDEFTRHGEGCPATSTIGTVEVRSPLVEQAVTGHLYIAKPFDNPFDSLLAMYMVVRNTELGVMIKLAGKVESDSETGQLTTTFDQNPQLPFSSFRLKFRESARSPLVTPPTCGAHSVRVDFHPWSASDHDNPAPGEVVTRHSSFQVTEGPNGTPCPGSNADRPFNPQIQAGTLQNQAGAFSPFFLRMFRTDGEQEITSFSAELPPGLTGKLAGVERCSDAALAAAAGKSGAAETASPSCPESSYVGRSLVGGGVGPVLTYVPGRVYLAGPYNGAPLSVAAITSANVGPFDLGTVVVRSAFKIDPVTARVSVDAEGSDPLPHIIDGIPTHLRDIRVYMDREDFTLNPTNCDPLSLSATLTGTGGDFADPGDDSSADLHEHFQVANCANLGFNPRLHLRLFGRGFARSSNPRLRAVLVARPGQANIARTAVKMPSSLFLDQDHIRTICTRAQFATDTCPQRAIYGHAAATTPLLDNPLRGPVYLRSSNNPLPDLVADLRGLVRVEVAGRTDSVRGALRNTFDVVPDAPVSKFVLLLQGGNKSLLVASQNLCRGAQRARVNMLGQNGKRRLTRPKLRIPCGKRKGNRRGARRASVSRARAVR